MPLLDSPMQGFPGGSAATAIPAATIELVSAQGSDINLKSSDGSISIVGDDITDEIDFKTVGAMPPVIGAGDALKHVRVNVGETALEFSEYLRAGNLRATTPVFVAGIDIFDRSWNHERFTTVDAGSQQRSGFIAAVEAEYSAGASLTILDALTVLAKLKGANNIANLNGIEIDAQIAGTGSATSAVAGIQANADVLASHAGTTPLVIGGNFNARARGGTVTTVRGLMSLAHGIGGTITNLLSYRAQIVVAGATVTDGWGIKIENSISSGSLTGTIRGIEIDAITAAYGATDHIGLQIGNVSGGSGDNRAIRTGTGLVEFGDNVELVKARSSILFTDGNGTDTVTLRAPANAGGAIVLDLPPSAGSVDEVIRTDGAGILTFVTIASLGAAILAGQAGGQVLNGGTGAGENLTLQSTAHATPGTIIFADDAQVQALFLRKKTEPAQITADTNNFAPGVGNFYLIDADAARNITGWASGAGNDAADIVVVNDGSFTITFKDEDAASTAANRFQNDTGADIALAAGERLTMIYDTTASRWRVSKSGADGGDFSDGGDAFGAEATIGNNSNFGLGFRSNNLVRYTVEANGDMTAEGDFSFLPTADNQYSFGSATKRLKLVAAVDVEVGDQRFVDPITRELRWTLTETADDLIVINAKTGKKHRLLMQEIN